MTFHKELTRRPRRCLKKRRLLKKVKRRRSYDEWLDKLKRASLDFPANGPIDKNMLWAEYELHIDLYKHYMTIVATFVGLYYTVTGVFLGYYFKNIDTLENDIIRWAIVFPILMSGFFSYVFFHAFKTFKDVEVEIENISDTFGYKRPEVRILTQILGASFGMFASTGVFITTAALHYHWPVLRSYFIS